MIVVSLSGKFASRLICAEAINAMKESIDDSELYGVFQEHEDSAVIFSECDNFAVDGAWKIIEL